jgi:putative membrane protein
MTTSSSAANPGNFTKYKIMAAVLGVIIPVAVAILYFFPQVFRIEGAQVKALPKVNAVLNSLTAVFLMIGYYFIRRKDVAKHRAMMGMAFLLGSLFLVSYVAYHSQVASTRFGGEGLIKGIYYFILLTHIVLAAITVGLVLFTLYFALTEQFQKHRRIARWTYPIWLYVSVTGVIVYFMISPYYT